MHVKLIHSSAIIDLVKRNGLTVDANKFLTGMPNTCDVVEREANVFNVMVKDPNAPVEFYIGGNKVTGDDPRYEVHI